MSDRLRIPLHWTTIVALTVAAVAFTGGMRMTGGRTGATLFGIGFAAIFVAGAVRVVVLVRRFRAGTSPPRRGRLPLLDDPAYVCPTCGYDFTAATAAFCPECGTVRPARVDGMDAVGASEGAAD